MKKERPLTLIFIGMAIWSIRSPSEGQSTTVAKPALYQSANNPLTPLLRGAPTIADAPVYHIDENRLVYHDRNMDYDKVRQQNLALFTDDIFVDESSPDNGQMFLTSPETQARVRLQVELLDGNAKRVFFESQIGVIYRIEQSSDLSNWTLLEEVVAGKTETRFYSFDTGKQFYRVVQPDNRIQFPEWLDFVEQYLYFDVWTSIVGTYHLELYADGKLQYQTSQAVPATGSFGVYDGNYDPSHWPYTGYYDADLWELRVTIIPAARQGEGQGGGPAQATVKKKQRTRHTTPPYSGITVQQYGAFPAGATVQEEIDNYMLNYFLSNIQAAESQIDLQGSPLNEFTAISPSVLNAADWSLLRGICVNANVDYFHYLGHGGKTFLGNGGTPLSIALANLRNSTQLRARPMTVVFLDGCRSAENPDFIESLIGLRSQMSLQTFIDRGLTPRFGAGWNKSKRIEYISQGTLVYHHFDFWIDFLNDLTVRDVSGYMFHSYRHAYEFAKTPNGQGIDPNVDNNSEASGFVPVGCYDCVFDW